ncbi:MAG: hypothetical protein ACR2J6_06140 [Thermoleophilaceae bacterium]
MTYLWGRLGFEQKVAALAALLLIASTFGPFSMVEAAMVLTGLGVLALLRARAGGRRFHLPSGDGTVLVLAAAWYALLIVVRVLDRPLGQSVLALACAAVLAAAGLRERARRPSDDVAPAASHLSRQAAAATAPLHRDGDMTEPLRRDMTEPPHQDQDMTEPLHQDQDMTEPLHQDQDMTEPLHQNEDVTEPLRRDKDETVALPPSGPRPPRPQDPPRPR